ncbi:MAG: hypothetical protein KJP07_08070 [Desulfatitalea sp.]|nr:hypothetical protein [Desulfatitalea sp.]
MSKPLNRKWVLGMGLSYDFERWNFNDISSIAGTAPWRQIHRIGLSLPVFHAPSLSWRLGAVPMFEFAGTPGANLEKSLSYGVVLTALKVFGPQLTLGIGAGVFSRLEEVSGFPYLAINWAINDQWRLQNPLRSGPAGPAGLELVYSPDERWTVGAGGAYRTYRFRLDEKDAIINGIGEVGFAFTFVRATRRLGAGITVDVTAGALFDGDLTVENDRHNDVGATGFDTTPMVALTLSGRL